MKIKLCEIPVLKSMWCQKSNACTGANPISKSPITWHWKHNFIPSGLLLFGVVCILSKANTWESWKKWKLDTCEYNISLKIEAKSLISMETGHVYHALRWTSSFLVQWLHAWIGTHLVWCEGCSKAWCLLKYC